MVRTDKGVAEFCKNYEFRTDYICEVVKRRQCRKILIQLPEGFLRCIPFLYKELSRCVESVEILFSLNPSHGSCLLDELGSRISGSDLLVHIGHVEYPNYTPAIPVLFIPAEYTGVHNLRFERIVDYIRTKNVQSVLVLTTSQHAELSRWLVEFLNTKGFRAEYGGIVTGCLVPKIPKDIDITLVVAGGRFHAIGVALRNLDRASTIVMVDPYTGAIRDVQEDVKKILRIRYWKIAYSREAKTWVVIDGVYGQHRPSIVDKICQLIRQRGGTCIKTIALYLDQHVLENLDSEDVDVFVVASCPRIPIDDLYEFRKPVLTPGEAYMVLTGEERYVYPW